MFVCQLCKTQFEDLKKLHRHLKSEKMRVDEYYYTFYPKLDLWTNKQIKFKDYESYQKTIFSNRENLSAWFRENKSLPEAKELAKQIFLQRKEEKNLKIGPTQVELRSIISPSVIGIEQLFGSYPDFLESLGMSSKFLYSDFPEFKSKNVEILIDTREQSPLSFEKSRIAKLDTGDYTAGKDHYCDIYVERKSVSDFFSTFYTVKNFDRVRKEFVRARDLGFYIFVLVEDTLTRCLNYSTRFVRNGNLISHTFKNVRTVIENYPVQFVFCKNRAHMKDVILKIFTLGADSQKYDFEYLTEIGMI